MNVRKRYISNFIILFFITIYSFIYQMFIVKKLFVYSEFINVAFLIIILFLAVLFLGFQKDKINYLKKSVITKVIITLLIFFAISYGSGIFVGFLKNSYSLKFASIIDNIFAPICVIIILEMLRYIVVKANSDKKIWTVLITIVFIIFEVAINVKGSYFASLDSIFKYGTSLILPIIVKNCMLSYLVYNAGYKPGLIYRLLMDIYVFVIPIVPNFSDYINSMIGICLPILIYMFSSRTIQEYNNGIEYDFSKKIIRLSDIPIILFIVIFVALLSGLFPLFIVSVGSDSMNPHIYKGDVVVVKKLDSEKELKLEDVVVYDNKGKRIVHRLMEKEKINNKIHYKTKGDMNKTLDNVDLTYKDIEGKVLFRIKYIGYPSIIFNELIRNKKR